MAMTLRMPPQAQRKTTSLFNRMNIEVNYSIEHECSTNIVKQFEYF